MGTILQLDPTRRSIPPDATRDAPRQCEIIIFPGVRIERHDIVPAATGFDATGQGPDRPPHRRKTS